MALQNGINEHEKSVNVGDNGIYSEVEVTNSMRKGTNILVRL